MSFFGDIGKKSATENPPFHHQESVERRPPWAACTGSKCRSTAAEPHPEQAPLPNDPEDITKHIKSLAYFLAADMVGICEMSEWTWYSHDIKGNEIDAPYKYAIVIDEGWDTFEGPSGDDWISGA